MPEFSHHSLVFSVPDKWWAENGMIHFVPRASSYRPGAPEQGKGLEDLPILLIPIDAIPPVHRQKTSHGVFNNLPNKPARRRVGEILDGFRRGDAIAPVEVFRLPAGSTFSHELVDGCHRFYCSVAVGFTHVPVVEVPRPGPFEDI